MHAVQRSERTRNNMECLVRGDENKMEDVGGIEEVNEMKANPVT